MNCHYCNQVCEKNEIQSVDFCHPCQVRYHGVAITLYTNLNGKEYSVKFINGPCDFPTRIGLSRPGSWVTTVLFNLTTRPDINPTNIQEKLKLYLTFS